MHVLLGNHEIRNLRENYKDVSEEDIAKFGSKENRMREFSKEGEIGHYLRGLNATVKIDDLVFVHGGYL